MEINLTACKYTNMNKKSIQRMILSIVELFANVTYRFFYISNHHQSNANMWCIFWIIFNFKMKRKYEKNLSLVSLSSFTLINKLTLCHILLVPDRLGKYKQNTILLHSATSYAFSPVINKSSRVALEVLPLILLCCPETWVRSWWYGRRS